MDSMPRTHSSMPRLIPVSNYWPGILTRKPPLIWAMLVTAGVETAGIHPILSLTLRRRQVRAMVPDHRSCTATKFTPAPASIRELNMVPVGRGRLLWIEIHRINHLPTHPPVVSKNHYFDDNIIYLPYLTVETVPVRVCGNTELLN